MHALIGKAACCSSISPIRRNGYVAQPPARCSQCVDSGRVLGVALGRVRVSGMGICCKDYLTRDVPFKGSGKRHFSPSPLPPGSILSRSNQAHWRTSDPVVTCEKKEFSAVSGTHLVPGMLTTGSCANLFLAGASAALRVSRACFFCLQVRQIQNLRPPGSSEELGVFVITS